ncbi:serine/threonine protein phosphatase [Streptomyces antioxidans]|uniref:non-specific serine/threonine protein kinase n=1 Tax=Streptomyces antioxidans TaxID=1507734 RepID=A0A1V4DDA8_9ACTN|nr:protein kinase [Streptomyces antioxidans]OPF84699.1 serine/threonine protein phosphatase [Streptomyces antioxidans]
MSDEGHLIAGRYRLVEKVGRGGMGTVWRAEDELLGRQVAVKQLHVSPHLAEDELTTLHERTRREARSAARITHPNVVVVHDVVDHYGLPCIVMEYVPSTTLADLLKDGGRVSPDEAARIGRGMIAALRAAHAAGVLHRDVKPGNVLLGPEGRVVLTDFGIAMATGTSTLTKTGEVVGSIDYIAPERVRGRKPGPASDLWALGATLYQAVEGRPPFRKATAIETGYAIAVDPLDPPQRAGALTPLIESLLAKEPELRPTAEETERALRLPASEPETSTLRPPPLDTTTTNPPLDATMNLSTRREPGTGTDRTSGTDRAPGTDQTNGTDRTTGTDAHAAPNPSTTSPPYHHTTHTPGTPHDAHNPPTTSHAANAAHNPPTATPFTTSTPSLTAPTPVPEPAPAPARRSRKAVWTAAAASLAVVAVAGGIYVYGLDHDNGGGTGGRSSATGNPSPSPPKPYTAPSGYHIVKEKKFGFSLPIPDGWTRQEKNDPDGNTVDRTQEVRYLDSTGLAGLRINVLDFASGNEVQHFKDLEVGFKDKREYPIYERLRLQETKYQGMPAAIWEFRFRGEVRMFRAVDLGFGNEGDKEYAIYLSAPDADWSTYRPIFDEVRDGFRIIN